MTSPWTLDIMYGHWSASTRFEAVCSWLQNNHLAGEAQTCSGSPEPPGWELLSRQPDLLLSLECRRLQKSPRAALNAVEREYGPRLARALQSVDMDMIWSEVSDPTSALSRIDRPVRMPADAMACYRPFHSSPFDQWGIYISVHALLDYYRLLRDAYRSVQSLPLEMLAALVLFEIFHHEFFHHLVEVAATTMEVVLAAAGAPRPVYLQYKARRYEADLGVHPHTPLEEALANAYAFNSFSFATHVSRGYMEGAVRLYQAAIERYWHLEPAGYRDAENYIRGNTCGGAQLLGLLLGEQVAHHFYALPALAHSVFPSGHAAFFAKPDIPTYLLGTQSDFAEFSELVPAPNATYSRLFWPGAVGDLDSYLQVRRRTQREDHRSSSPQERR